MLPNGYTHYLIETYETEEIEDDTQVCLTPYNPKTGNWMPELMEITVAKEATKRKKIVCKKEEKKLIKYIEKKMKERKENEKQTTRTIPKKKH